MNRMGRRLRIQIWTASRSQTPNCTTPNVHAAKKTTTDMPGTGGEKAGSGREVTANHAKYAKENLSRLGLQKCGIKRAVNQSLQF